MAEHRRPVERRHRHHAAYVAEVLVYADANGSPRVSAISAVSGQPDRAADEAKTVVRAVDDKRVPQQRAGSAATNTRQEMPRRSPAAPAITPSSTRRKAVVKTCTSARTKPALNCNNRMAARPLAAPTNPTGASPARRRPSQQRGADGRGGGHQRRVVRFGQSPRPQARSDRQVASRGGSPWSGSIPGSSANTIAGASPYARQERKGDAHVGAP